MVALRAMTTDELLQCSHEPYRTELIAGTLVELEPAGALHGVLAAGIAFEVTSPRDRRGEVESRTRSWLDAGTSGTQRLDLDDVLPGFAPRVDELFA